jgi:membrane-bound metal-dependent hydrolase YbcI (DUF457 family)
MARLDAHYALSLGVTALLLRFSIGGFVAALVTDYLIDHAGHSWRGMWVRRSPLTHSIVTAPIWGFAVGLVIGVLFTFASIPSIGETIVGGLVASICHLSADSLTGNGIFIPAKWGVKH